MSGTTGIVLLIGAVLAFAPGPGARALAQNQAQGQAQSQAPRQALGEVRDGNQAFKAGLLEQAVAAYTAAITSGEMQAEALAITYNNRGVALAELNEIDRAIADYHKALELLPQDATTLKNLRVAHVKRGIRRASEGALDAAMADYDAAIDAEPEHPTAYLRRAELHVTLGQAADALADFEAARARQADDPRLDTVIAGLRDALAPKAVPEPVDAARAGGDASPDRPETPAGTDTAAREAASAAGDTMAEAPSEDGAENEAEAVAEPEAAVAEPRSAPDAPATPVAAPARPSNEAESATADASEPRTEPAPGSAPAPAVEPALGPTAGADRRGAEEVAAAPAAGELARGTRWRAVQAVNVRAGPSNDSERVTTVDGGTEVTVLDEELGWKEVVLPDGRRGYIYRKWLSPVDG
ncbi:MAG: SH3 domain-containing protein [Geminicoccaceae bacterium]|nr:SH3 domain-containing protein [Geminicoccaceae bacterium]